MAPSPLERAASACNGRRARRLRHASGAWSHIQAPHHGRTASCPAAPVQIPACGTTAPGSSKLLASHIATSA